jgi:hypothetical protein
VQAQVSEHLWEALGAQLALEQGSEPPHQRQRLEQARLHLALRPPAPCSGSQRPLHQYSGLRQPLKLHRCLGPLAQVLVRTSSSSCNAVPLHPPGVFYIPWRGMLCHNEAPAHACDGPVRELW